MNWPGSVTFTLASYSGTTTNFGTTAAWFCANINVQNTGTVTAKGMIIKFNSCYYLARLADNWGYTSYNDTTSNFMELASGIWVGAGSSFAAGGFCMDVNWVHHLNEFKFPDSFRVSADLYSEAPNCILPNCQFFCGDGICNSPNESTSNCPGDCNPLVCPSSRRFLSYLRKGGII